MKSYQDFLIDNSSQGYLKIKAYSANEAIPISGVKIVISKVIDDEKIIFFEGVTDESGIIERITLPAPEINSDNLNAPKSVLYDIESTYKNINRDYSVRIFDGILVVQSINIIPQMGENYGS